MAGLARLILRRRKAVVAVWFVLTVIGAVSAGQIKWFQSFSIPGYSAYEANQRTLKDFGSGLNTPLVAVVTRQTGASGCDRGEPRRALQLVLLHRQQRVRVEGQAHDVR